MPSRAVVRSNWLLTTCLLAAFAVGVNDDKDGLRSWEEMMHLTVQSRGNDVTFAVWARQSAFVSRTGIRAIRRQYGVQSYLSIIYCMGSRIRTQKRKENRRSLHFELRPYFFGFFDDAAVYPVHVVVAVD